MFALHEAEAVCDPDVTVTVALFRPPLPYVVETEALLLFGMPVPLHEYEYDPLPPFVVATQLTVSPMLAVNGEDAQETVRVGREVEVMLALHVAVAVCVPDVTVTKAV